MKISVRLYGHFRKFGDRLALELPADSRIWDLEQAFVHAITVRDPSFYENAALRASRFCNDQAILPRDHPLAGDAELSILPPVSGG
ncbi:MAG TPA: MoaD/ThiS family protein [Gammaproteobacteria bacterium]